jgi:hypothetical protein
MVEKNHCLKVVGSEIINDVDRLGLSEITEHDG